MKNLLIDKIFNIATIRTKMIAYFFATVILLSFLTIYTFYVSQQSLNQMDEMYEKNLYLVDISNKLSQANDNLLNFLTVKSSDSFIAFQRSGEEIKGVIEATNRDLSYNPSQLLFVDVSNMIYVYFSYADSAINAKRGRNDDETNQSYTKATEIEGYIQEYIAKIQLNQIKENATRYQIVKDKVSELQKTNVVLIVDVMLFSILIIIILTYRMTEPIIRLAHSADEISSGNFEIDEIVVDSEDEIKVMATAFNKMRENIKNYIEELKNKAETEAKLMDQELQNIKMQSLLNKAELEALQSQINPHFLFNTINTGVQLAMMEGADVTSEFLENMSAIFRYNIKNLKKPVTLGEEIDNIKAYAMLLKVRFGEFLKFEFDIEDGINEINMPPLILQPLVENACIHGIGDLEEGGVIRITTKKDADMVHITIEDDGVGMDQEYIDKVLYHTNEEDLFKKPKKSHTTGIGLANVIHRLRLFSQNEDAIEISSDKSNGTKIIIHLPICEEAML
ncbi:MAG: ATPase [Firmicutes bacterium HGW-Firmicutes-1]|nr:MAG: ATPase [Firmicutes bacterium HGW-Firmicutes-1]